ncbi:MAG: hypothetical protein QF774_07015, partial [Nitrospinota bacterium]|nr:hypothetical protein [Nitrospinota bacterium]
MPLNHEFNEDDFILYFYGDINKVQKHFDKFVRRASYGNRIRRRKRIMRKFDRSLEKNHGFDPNSFRC